MTIVYNQATINSRLNAVVTNIDAGPGNGQMRLLAAASTTVALVTLQKPSGTAGSGILTFNGLPLASPLTTISALVTSADIEDSTGTVVASGLTVGGSTSFDVFMSNPFVSSGQTVTLIFAQITGR